MSGWRPSASSTTAHDLDHVTDACRLAELLAAETFVSFGPDTRTEARNRSYRPCRHCVRDDEDVA